MAFDHINIRRRPASLLIGGTHRSQLTFRGRCQQTTTDIIGQADAANYGIDVISGTHGILGALEQKHAAPLADHQAIAIGIERRAGAGGRKGVQLRKTHLGIK